MISVYWADASAAGAAANASPSDDAMRLTRISV
jgi:hypothetical protein